MVENSDCPVILDFSPLLSYIALAGQVSFLVCLYCQLCKTSHTFLDLQPLYSGYKQNETMAKRIKKERINQIIKSNAGFGSKMYSLDIQE